MSDIRDYFELRTVTGAIIRGSVAPDVVPELGRFYGREVEATLDVTVAISEATGAEKRAYRLEGLSTLRQGTLTQS